MNLGDSAAYGAPSLSRRRFYGMDPFKAQRLNKSVKFFLTWKLPFLMPRVWFWTSKNPFVVFDMNFWVIPVLGLKPPRSISSLWTILPSQLSLGTMDAARRYLETSEILTLNHPNGCGSTPWIPINSCYSMLLVPSVVGFCVNIQLFGDGSKPWYLLWTPSHSW